MTFAYTVDQDQTAQKVQSDLDLQCSLRWYFYQKNDFDIPISGFLTST